MKEQDGLAQLAQPVAG